MRYIPADRAHFHDVKFIQNFQVAQQAYKVAQDDQKITEKKAKIWEATEKLKILEGHIENLSKLINTGEGNITRMRAQIERKQTVIDQMNKKLEHLVSTSGKRSNFRPSEPKGPAQKFSKKKN